MTNNLKCLTDLLQNNNCPPYANTLITNTPGINQQLLLDSTNPYDPQTVPQLLQQIIQFSAQELEQLFLQTLDQFWTFCPNETTVANATHNPNNTTTSNHDLSTIHNLIQTSHITLHAFHANIPGNAYIQIHANDNVTNQTTTLYNNIITLDKPNLTPINHSIVHTPDNNNPYSIQIQFDTDDPIAKPTTLHIHNNRATYPNCKPCQPCITTTEQHHGITYTITNYCNLQHIICHLKYQLLKPLANITNANILHNLITTTQFNHAHTTKLEQKNTTAQNLRKLAQQQTYNIVKQLQPDCNCCLKPNPIHHNKFTV